MGLGLPRLLLYFEEYVESKPPPPAARSGLFLLLVRALLRPIAVAGLPSSRPFPMGWRPDFMPAVAEENLLASLSIMLAWSRLPAGALLGRLLTLRCVPEACGSSLRMGLLSRLPRSSMYMRWATEAGCLPLIPTKFSGELGLGK